MNITGYKEAGGPGGENGELAGTNRQRSETQNDMYRMHQIHTTYENLDCFRRSVNTSSAVDGILVTERPYSANGKVGSSGAISAMYSIRNMHSNDVSCCARVVERKYYQIRACLYIRAVLFFWHTYEVNRSWQQTG
jgi:hypothetical protein